MKRFFNSIIVVAFAASAAVAFAQQKPNDKSVDVTGKWTMSLDMSMGRATPALDLMQDGTKLTGSYTGRYGSFPLKGTLTERKITFSFDMGAEGQTVTMTFTGEVAADGQSMKGTASMGDMGDASWTAARNK